MKWIIAIDRERIEPALNWADAFFRPFDLSRVDWIRIDKGRGRCRGVYGRCWYPAKKKGYRISCQVPGPFPCDISLRLPPIYITDANRPESAETFAATLPPGQRLGAWVTSSNGRAWVRVRGTRPIADINEGLVWLLAHEGFHFLRRSRQVPGRNTEIEADAFAEAEWSKWKQTALTAKKRDDYLFA